MSSIYQLTMKERDEFIVRSYQEFGIVKEMTQQERVNAPAPTQVSNRTIYDRCIEWGCKVTKTNGNWVWMQSPVQLKFKIRPPQQHVANSKFDIEAMLDAIALPWPEFIAAEILDAKEFVRLGEGFKRSGGPSPEPEDEMGPCSMCDEPVIRAVMVKRGKKIAHSYCANKPVEAQPDTRFKLEPQPEPEHDPTPEEIEPVSQPVQEDPSIEEEVVALPRGRYINSVFDLLVERGDPMSNQAVAEVLSITPSQATSAMAQLASQGVVTRVKSGVYQAKPGLLRKAGTLGIVVSGEGPTDGVFTREMVETARRPQPVTFSSVESVQVEPDGDEDETLNELLDLICPNGFKARHLPIIDQFKRCALELMREVNDGA